MKGKTTKIKGAKERGMGVLLEQIDSKLDLVVEGHQVSDKKIENLEDNMNTKFQEVDYKFEIVFGELKRIEGKSDLALVKADQSLAKADQSLAMSRMTLDELHVIRNELKEKVSRDEFVLLENRVSHLEKTTRSK